MKAYQVQGGCVPNDKPFKTASVSFAPPLLLFIYFEKVSLLKSTFISEGNFTAFRNYRFDVISSIFF